MYGEAGYVLTHTLTSNQDKNYYYCYYWLCSRYIVIYVVPSRALRPACKLMMMMMQRERCCGAYGADRGRLPPGQAGT